MMKNIIFHDNVTDILYLVSIIFFEGHFLWSGF